jgi:hypothetical protein
MYEVFCITCDVVLCSFRGWQNKYTVQQLPKNIYLKMIL